MTIIAFDGTTLAADKRGVVGGLIMTLTKIRRSGTKRLMGASGDTSTCNEMLDWIECGRNPETFPERQRDEDTACSALVIENGKILQYGYTPYPTVVEGAFHAIGSGREIAITAMHLGKTAKEAVEIASLFMCDCGNGVDTLTLEGE